MAKTATATVSKGAARRQRAASQAMYVPKVAPKSGPSPVGHGSVRHPRMLHFNLR